MTTKPISMLPDIRSIKYGDNIVKYVRFVDISSGLTENSDIAKLPIVWATPHSVFAKYDAADSFILKGTDMVPRPNGSIFCETDKVMISAYDIKGALISEKTISMGDSDMIIDMKP